VGWEALDQWGDDVARIEPLTGGVGVNEVWRVRVNRHLAVARLGKRSDSDLSWETELLRHLDREGMTVPVPIPTEDGRYFADGLVVMTYVEGGPPESEADWRRVADTLRQLHRLTDGWPQRPGWSPGGPEEACGLGSNQPERRRSCRIRGHGEQAPYCVPRQ
jgi:Ser/Thr protein kinase RdoA (MazF antagonist)